DPTGINFGEVAPSDTAATRVVMIRSNNLTTPEMLNVTKADSTVAGVMTSIKPTANKGEYEVTLQLAKDAKPGDMNGNVKIYTNDKINPIITIPVRGTVKSISSTPSASK